MKPTASWQDWIAAHGPQLVMYASRWGRDRSEAEDLVQEAFVRFWRRRDDVDDPLAYLYRCVRTVACDAARRRDAEERRDDRWGAGLPAFSCFQSTLETEEERQHIERALAALPVEQYEVVTLKIWSGLTFAQVAEVTGAPPGTVASRFRYALGQLREVLQENVQ